MVGSVLTNDKGISHSLFAEGGEGDAEGDAETGSQGEPKEATDKDDILKTSKFKYIPEVVREPAMHFWRVPRLGAFMAVPLVYNSCLSEEALDDAIANWAEIKTKIDEQAKEREEFEEEQR